MINTLHFNTSHEAELLTRIKAEINNIGYYNLPEQKLDYVDDYLTELDKKQKITSIKDVVIIGIGGSSLGAKAIYHFISKVKKPIRKLHFIDSTDPISISHIFDNIDCATTHFIVISKSGETIETIAAYKYTLEIINKSTHKHFPFTFITETNSKLEQHGISVNGIIVNIDNNISGRFSVLSSAGLIPLTLAGIDIQALLAGANKIKNNFFNNQAMQQTLLKKATFYAKNSTRYNINAIFSYSDSLQYFNQWYTQLWGESLGKRQKNSAFNVGLTPIGLIGPKDQHSFLQLLVEGKHDKTVSFIKIAKFKKQPRIPNISLDYINELDIINNIGFGDLINMQADAIIQTLKNSLQIPLDEIIIKEQDEFNIGQLIYYYQLLTSLVGDLLGVNTYNQPGVEQGKQILIKKLTKIKRQND